MAKRVSKSAFRRRVLAYLDEVATGGETLVVTDRGRPVVKIEPQVDAAAALARLRGCVVRYDDPTEPVGWISETAPDAPRSTP